jgi:mannose-6-phosphate isomerase-like protein (cupin superfamily)
VSTVNFTTSPAAEVIQVGPIRLRILEDGSRTDNRIGAVEIMLPPGAAGPPPHLHRMHDETFLVTSGVVRFTMGETERDAHVGDYVVVPIGAMHTFSNPSNEPAVFFNTFTPAFYVNYLREMAVLVANGNVSSEGVERVMARYATQPS